MEKEEYIRKLKQLIKKYHPDLCKDTYLERMYNEITIKLNQKLSQIRTENNIKENIFYRNYGKINLSQNKNTKSYEYYKLGIKFYRNIHMNKFYKRNVDGTFEPKTYEEQLVLLNKIFISFNSAEYYFTRVIMEYPESEWTDDAKEKIKLLKKLYKSYENINIEENNKIIDNNKFVKEMGLKIL